MSHNYEQAYTRANAVGQRVGGHLNSKGISCIVPELKIAKSPDEWRTFTLTEKDIILSNGEVLEVKEINQYFTEHPSSWPFSEVIVDTVSGYNAKLVKPIAYIFVSRKTGAMLTMATEKPRNWTIRRKFDRHRQIEDDFYFASTKSLRPMWALIKYLQGRVK